MATMAMGTANKKLSVICLAILTSLHTAHAGEWDFTPSLTLEENYTDNVELVDAGETESLVSQLGIDFSLDYLAQGAEFTFNSSSIYATYSHDHDLDDGFLELDTNGRFALWPNGIALVFSATVENQARNGARNALADIVSGDTVQTERYSGGFEYQIDNSDFQFFANATYNLNQADDDIGEQEGFSSQILTKNGNASRNVFWDFNANYLERTNNDQDSKRHIAELKLGWITNYKINPFIRAYNEDNTGNVGNNNSYESNSYGVGLRWLVTPRFYLDVSYNKPEDEQQNIDGEEQEEYVNAEVNWQPTSRTTLNASYGQRFYGESYSLDLTHRNKRLTNSIRYSEEVQVFTRDNYEYLPQGAFWCPIDFIESSECYVEPGDNFNFDDYNLVTFNDFEIIEDNEFSLNKRVAWTSELKLPRTTFSFDLNFNDRESLETRISDRNSGANFKIDRRVSGYSTVDLKLTYTEKLFDYQTENERTDRYRQYAINYKRDLNAKFNFNVTLAHVNRDSSQETFNYKESRVTLKFIKDF
ncbi:TIGR03016 family PEP-CTERM system-associated outer membrane protein [Thalassotalea eurytherma]|uniref:TIGR03016 family PEP-CTERM system-associated outer membrane protein n=1 Tax=Thalassotalea eurytherma TaxID=1144278 RepID=A0ABQ6H3J3_9GAMM|nr:TIGR03016 family PEP-CTERM system-associated outer membrane protein [Thalassotalea eurytherma]GLX82084.1 hypothetical protein theurythT_15360 [Thalassotalea eurytherma]